MMHDQADELRQLMRQRALSGSAAGGAVPLLVISGGKGGVGTTTIAANLAIALARQGRRAVWVDADLDHGGNAHLGQHPERGSVIDVLAGRRSVHEVLERGPSGIQVLSGAWASGALSDCSAAAQDRFVADLKHLTPHADVVVIDAGSSRNQFARRFWQAASAVLTVTTADATSTMECYAAIKVLLAGDSSPPVFPLINLAPDAEAAGEVQARIADACRRFLGMQVTAAGFVERCESPQTAEPILIYPARSKPARALDRVADTLWTQLQRDPARRAVARSA